MSLEEVYQRGLELLDRYYARIEREEAPVSVRSDGKRMPTYSKEKKCAFPGCDRTIIAKGMRIYCEEHTEVKKKEHLKRGWDKQNRKRSERRRNAHSI